MEQDKDKIKLSEAELELLFDDLLTRMVVCDHLFGKTTYKIEMTFQEWYVWMESYRKYLKAIRNPLR